MEADEGFSGRSELDLENLEDLGGDVAGVRVEALREFFVRFKRALRNISLYRHSSVRSAEFIAPAFEVLSRLLESCPAISLSLDQRTFRHAGQAVHEDEGEEDLAFKFYRDGVRLIVFRSGLEASELIGLAQICLARPDATDQEDMGSLLWKQAFAHIEHVVMDTFTLGSESAEQTKVEVDEVVQALYQRLSTESKDTLTFARLSPDDLDIEIQDVGQVAGLVTGEPAASQGDRERFSAQVEQDLTTGNLRRLAEVLFRTFEFEPDPVFEERLGDAFEQVLDGLLLQEQLHEVGYLLDELQAVRERRVPGESRALSNQIQTRLLARLCEQERIDRLGEILETNRKPEVLALVALLLERLDVRVVEPLFVVLERLSRKEARELVSQTIARFGLDMVDEVASRLQSPKANFVRDLLSILQRLNPPGKSKLVAGLLNHPSLPLRLEALSIIGDGQDLAGSAYVMKATEDRDPQVRTAAVRLLPNYDRGVALCTLLAIIDAPDFDDRPEVEQSAVYGALCSLDDPKAREALRGRLREGALQTRRQLSRRRNVIVGLANSGSIAAFKLLREEIQAGLRDRELQALAERAVAHLKKVLLRDPSGEE